MTWTKLGTEFFKECIHHGLSDAMTRTHAEAIGYLYDVEESSCRIPKRSVRLFAGSEDYTDAITGLVSLDWWKDNGTHWEVLHHADVVRQSIAAQQAKQSRDKRSQKAWRQRQKGADGEPPVSDDVSAYTDRQTDKQLEDDHKQTCDHGIEQGDEPNSWFTAGMACADCARERKGA